MKDYSAMSDFEINMEVSISIYGRANFTKGDNPIVLRGFEIFDPCNSWADAGPIIQDNGIELNYDGISWSAACRFRDIGWYSDWKNYPESPLRLAMITLLMMKDAEYNV